MFKLKDFNIFLVNIFSFWIECLQHVLEMLISWNSIYFVLVVLSIKSPSYSVCMCMTSGDLQKEWKIVAEVKGTAKLVINLLLWVGLKSCKAKKKAFINDNEMERTGVWLSSLMSSYFSFFYHLINQCRDADLLRPTSHSVSQVLSNDWWSSRGKNFNKAGIGHIFVCEGCMNQVIYKVIWERNYAVP